MADRVAEFSYPDDKKETVDIINLLLLGWILLGLVVYILGNVIATQIRKRKSKKAAEKGTPSSPCSTEPHATSSEFHHQSTAPTCIVDAAQQHNKQADGGISSSGHDLNSLLLPSPLKDSAVIPVCTGDDSDVVEWINRVFLWIYKNRIVSPILEPWLTSLNAKTRLLSTEHGILVDFQNVLQSNQPPVFSEVLESKGVQNKVHAACEAEIQNLSFDILVTQVKERDKNIYKFILKLERLAGQLSMECVPEELLFQLFFCEGTQVQLNIEPSPTTKIPDEEYEMLHGLVCDIASKAFSSSPVDLCFTSFPECPRYRRIELSISNALAESLEKEKEEKLLVKIVKANNLGGEKGCSKPYCIVEMDEPPQKFETQPTEAESNPLWDESHIFIVKDISAELLFEVYDKDRKPNENFLGLGIVSIEELMRNPSQRQVIPLQSRPMEKDDVTGSLTAEFLFLGWDLPSPDSCMLGQSQMIMEEGSGKIIETNSRVTARGTIITTTTIKQMKEEPTDVTNTALRELEKQDASSSTSVSTLIIHSVQKDTVQPSMKVKKDESGMWQEVAEPESSGTDSLEASPASYPSVDSHSSPHLSLPPSPSVQRNGGDRSRPKEKKSLISNLKKKLSFRKQRSRSVEQQRAGSSPVPLKANNRSVSTERVKGSHTGEKNSVWNGRPLLAVPGSTRSSFSEASGLSTASSRTYINEHSKLVVEVNENGIIKRYFVPTCMIHRTKFIKRGVKLHLYNDHVFVAKHLSGATMCQVCKKNLTRRPGKQGYECRDCKIQCHKSCHVKVAEFCPNSSVSSMEVMDIDFPVFKGKPQSI